MDHGDGTCWQELQQPKAGTWAQAWCEARGVLQDGCTNPPSAGTAGQAWHSAAVPPLTVLVRSWACHAGGQPRLSPMRNVLKPGHNAFHAFFVALLASLIALFCIFEHRIVQYCSQQ
jgi:hypothetical protein